MQAPCWTDFLQCSICTMKYNCTDVIPVSLSCSHSMCKRCISRSKQCPYDKTPIVNYLDKYPPNTTFLLLLGFSSEEWAHEMADVCPAVISDRELEGYTECREASEKLATFLKPYIDQGVLQATASIPRPILKKLISLLGYQFIEEEGRGRALRATHSIAERIITELLVMHQNQQQISTLLWSAVRGRGCQFLGPVMQEEILKLIIKVLENRRSFSRKNIVMYVVQQIKNDFPNASKTNIGHVVQLLYRASCFTVEKREDDSSLMQLKEEFCTYDALRREHDAQIIRIGMEAGLRISPEMWSTQLYGNVSKKSDMQSIIDKLISQGVGSSGLNELIVAIGRSHDPYKLNEKLIPHLETLLQIPLPSEKTLGDIDTDIVCNTCTWEACAKGLNELLISLQIFTDFTQIQSGRYKTGMCPYLIKPGGCPRGTFCPYAHTEEEKKKYVTIAKNNTKKGKPRSDITRPYVASVQSTIPHRSDMMTSSLPVGGRYIDTQYHSLEESPYTYHGGGIMYQPDGTSPFLVQNHGIPPSYQPVPAPMTQGYVPLQRIGNLSGDQLMQGGVLPVGTGRTPSSSDYFSYQPSDSRPMCSIDSNNSGSLYSLDSFPSGNHSNELTVNIVNSTSSSADSTPLTTSQLYLPQESEKISMATTLSVDAMKYTSKSETINSFGSSSDESLSHVGGETVKASHVANGNDEHRPLNGQERESGGVATPSDDKMAKLEAQVKSLQLALQQKNEAERQYERQHPEHNSSAHMIPAAAANRFYYPSHYQGGSPHNSGPILPPTHHYAPPPAPMHPVMLHQTLPPANCYNPMQSGFPNQILGVHSAAVVHTTPPNTGLVVQGIPPHIGAPPHFLHPPAVTHHPHIMQKDNLLQEADEYLAHYLQFAEQSKASSHPVAPGAQLTSHTPYPSRHAHHHIPYQMGYGLPPPTQNIMLARRY